MRLMGKWKALLAAAMAIALVLVVAACGGSDGTSEETTAEETHAASTEASSAEPESGLIRMGIEPWIGYGPWYIAEEEGFFDKQGIEVEIVNFSTDTDREAAFVGGKTDVSNVPTQVALLLGQQNVPAKVVLLEDEALGADAILAKPPITSIEDLAGEKVAYEEGTTSDILLNHALEENGMTIDDVQRVPIPASNAGNAALAGKVGAAVTYEPYISAVLEENPEFEAIYDAGAEPGLISDVLMASEEMIADKPGQISALVQAWGEAIEFYEQHEEDGQEIITKAVGAEPGSLTSSFEGVRFYNLADNQELLSGEYATSTAVNVSTAAQNAGILDEDVDPSSVIDASFVEAAE